MNVAFEQVKLRGIRKWIDPETGKRRQKTRWFCQTVNPFNKNPDGTVKTRTDIFRELQQKRHDWESKEANR